MSLRTSCLARTREGLKHFGFCFTPLIQLQLEGGAPAAAWCRPPSCRPRRPPSVCLCPTTRRRTVIFRQPSSNHPRKDYFFLYVSSSCHKFFVASCLSHSLRSPHNIHNMHPNQSPSSFPPPPSQPKHPSFPPGWERASDTGESLLLYLY
jgi:hypothetical protein